MSPYILSVVIISLLLGALAYYDYVAPYKALQERMAVKNSTVWLLLLLFAITVSHFIFLDMRPLEQYIAALLLWLNVTFFLLLVKSGSQARSFLVAIPVSEFLVLSVYFAGEYANNLPLLLGLTAAVVLLLKSARVPARAFMWFFLIMAVVDAVFVWYIPAIPSLDSTLQSLEYSLLLKVGSISLGAGSIVLLLIAILFLARRVAWPLRIFYALVLSQSVTAAYLISMLDFFPGNVFPFALVLTPVFFFLYLARPALVRRYSQAR